MTRGDGPGDSSRQLGGSEAFASARLAMVEEQIARRGIADPRVLEAMTDLPRHRFIDTSLVEMAYDDRPLPIGFGQTISQPYMVARTTELARPETDDRALEVGAGCGYQTALLARLCAHVFAIELVPSLAAKCAETLEALGIQNVTVECFDGSGGWPAHAPFDVIIVSAAAPQVPALLVDQLGDGGRLVLPVGATEGQVLTCVTRSGSRYETVQDTNCRYVDLVGRYGIGSNPPRA